jgi:Family of unknown function (DUF6527)
VSALSPILRDREGGSLTFWCPGCNKAHGIQHGSGPGPRWNWNGDVNKPTFSPSVLVRTGRAVDPGFISEQGDPPEICHSFVADGRIEFLGDCTHALAGQTVDLPQFPGYEL